MTQQKQALFMEAYAPCHDPFIRYCSALAHGRMEVEDLVQDVLLTTYEQFEKISRKDQLLHYLIRAARNRSITSWRRSKRKKKLEEAYPNWCDSHGLSAEIILDIQILYQLMDRLPEKQRNAIILFEINGFSMKEIAAIQQSSVGAVKTSISRGRNSLRKMMQEKPEPKSLLALLGFSIPDSPFKEGVHNEQLTKYSQQISSKINQQTIAEMIDTATNAQPSKLHWFHRINSTSLMVSFSSLILIIVLLFNFLPNENSLSTVDASIMTASPDMDKSTAALALNLPDEPKKAPSQGIKSTLKGIVLAPDAQGLYLLKLTQDARGKKVKIPIVNGTFEYELEASHEEAYQFIYTEELDIKGRWKKIIFFAETGEINFVLHESERIEENKIKGGALNQLWSEFQTLFKSKFEAQYAPIQKEMGLLFQNDEYASDSMKVLLAAVKNPKNEKERTDLGRKIKSLRDNRLHLSPKAKILDDQRLAISEKALDWRYDYIKNNPSILSYYLLYEDLKKTGENTSKFGEMAVACEEFKKLYPDHPYTNILHEMIFSFQAIKVGGVYEDFLAPDLQGEEHQLSDLKQGKILVLHLWSSWCRTFLQTGRELIPVYEDYQGNDFTVVGVAREFKQTNGLEKTLEREQYPWLNLLELDDQHEIWLKYKIPFSGGGIFLIDREGQILAIDPTADEVRAILEEKGIAKVKK